MKEIKNTFTNKRSNAFTLAEILITLTIIGVVAAVTIPTLTKKAGNQEYVTRLLKVYSVLSQATDDIINEKGAPGNNWAGTTTSVSNYYKSKLKIGNYCGTTSGCFGGMSDVDASSIYQKFTLSDGASIAIRQHNSQCTHDDYSDSPHICASIFVDLNGKKAPNSIGRDLFQFVLRNDGLYPRACGGYNEFDEGGNIVSYCPTGGDWRCTCRVITEGEMNY